MHGIKRAGFLVKSRLISVSKSYNGLSSSLGHKSTNSVSDVRFAAFTSSATKMPLINDFTKSDIFGATGIACLLSDQQTRRSLVSFQPPFHLTKINAANTTMPSFARGFASTPSTGKNSSKTKKDISKVEDPFDAPTYNIPEKPVTFTEGASYSIIILAGLGVAAAAAYAVFKELIFEPKEYKIFGKALKRIQNDSQVSVRIGSPVTGYGQESRNRAARQRIPHRIWTDEEGVEHVEVNFYVRGPHGRGKVFTEMFKDKEDKQWKFTYMIVEIDSPSPARLMLESYIPNLPA